MESGLHIRHLAAYVHVIRLPTAPLPPTPQDIPDPLLSLPTIVAVVDHPHTHRWKCGCHPFFAQLFLSCVALFSSSHLVIDCRLLFVTLPPISRLRLTLP